MATSLKELLLVKNESKKRLGRERFDMNVLKSLKDIRQQKNYLNMTAMFIGAGSSRIAYAITPKHVVKLAGGKNFFANASDVSHVEVGIEQNKAEVEGYARASAEVKQILPRTVDIPGNGGDWIVSELVRPISSFEELQALAIDNESIIDADGEFYNMEMMLELLYNHVYGEDDRISSIVQQSAEPVGRFINSVLTAAEELDLAVVDMARVAQWGKTADGRVVLLDFGGTQDILDSYYGDGAGDDVAEDEFGG